MSFCIINENYSSTLLFSLFLKDAIPGFASDSWICWGSEVGFLFLEIDLKWLNRIQIQLLSFLYIFNFWSLFRFCFRFIQGICGVNFSFKEGIRTRVRTKEGWNIFSSLSSSLNAPLEDKNSKLRRMIYFHERWHP